MDKLVTLPAILLSSIIPLNFIFSSFETSNASSFKTVRIELIDQVGLEYLVLDKQDNQVYRVVDDIGDGLVNNKYFLGTEFLMGKNNQSTLHNAYLQISKKDIDGFDSILLGQFDYSHTLTASNDSNKQLGSNFKTQLTNHLKTDFQTLQSSLNLMPYWDYNQAIYRKL